MKYNPEIAKAVMLYLEKNLTFHAPHDAKYGTTDLYEYKTLNGIISAPQLAQYDKNDLAYTVLQLIHRDYLMANVRRDNMYNITYDASIFDISPTGHDYLANL